jgi:succinyl-diaminopimelate desuccinylase
VIEFGLVGKTMHKVDECADTADIEALTGIYEEIIRRALA